MFDWDVLTPEFGLQFEGGKHPDPDMVGLMQRSFTYLLKQAEGVTGNKVIRASYLEIYNEQVRKLSSLRQTEQGHPGVLPGDLQRTGKETVQSTTDRTRSSGRPTWRSTINR